MSTATDALRYRQVIGHFATGVAIVTCYGPDGPSGLTTNAITSVSLDPLLLLVCFDNGSRTLPAVRDARRFAVNVLRAGHGRPRARLLLQARRAREVRAVTHLDAHGVPVIDGALAWLACDLVDLHPAGDHTIGIGEITHMDSDPGGEPLVWFRGEYGMFAAE